MKIKVLEDRLRTMRERNHDAWMMYGSEPCAGEMIRKPK